MLFSFGKGSASQTGRQNGDGEGLAGDSLRKRGGALAGSLSSFHSEERDYLLFNTLRLSFLLHSAIYPGIFSGALRHSDGGGEASGVCFCAPRSIIQRDFLFTKTGIAFVLATYLCDALKSDCLPMFV